MDEDSSRDDDSNTNKRRRELGSSQDMDLGTDSLSSSALLKVIIIVLACLYYTEVRFKQARKKNREEASVEFIRRGFTESWTDRAT